MSYELGGINLSDCPDLMESLIINAVNEMQNKSKYTNELAKKSVIEELEKLYIALDMEIDCCQGAMDGLDVALAKLKVYEDAIKYLGGDIEEDRAELTKYWFETNINEEDETKEDDNQSDLLRLSNINRLAFWDIKNKDIEKQQQLYRDALFEIEDTLNRIVKYLKNK